MKLKYASRGMLAIASVALFSLCLGFSSTAAATTADGNPLAMSSILSTDQSKEDLLPKEEGGPFADGLGLVEASSRSLGSTGEAKYWLVVDQEQNLCLVTQFISDESSSITCAPTKSFQTLGMSSLIFSEENYSEAYLAPDGLTVETLPPGLTEIESGLIVGDSRGADDTLVLSGGDSVTRSSGSGSLTESVELKLLHPPTDEALVP